MTNDIRVPAGTPTGGQFAAHARTDGAVALGYKPEPVIAWVSLQEWVGPNVDTLNFLDRVEVDVVKILDAKPLATIEALAAGSDSDWVFETARDARIADAHDGPFDVDFDAEELDGYVAARRSRGDIDPIATAVEWIADAESAAVTDRHVDRITEEAGLGVMAGIISVLRDRETVPDATIRNWTAADVTDFYESFVGPAVDRIEADVLESASFDQN